MERGCDGKCDCYCKNCLNDHSKLQKRLEEDTVCGSRVDILGKYRSWLDKNGIPAENKFGWATDDAFMEEHIKAFVKEY